MGGGYFSKSNPSKLERNKRRILLPVIGGLVIVGIVVGTSFAFWQFRVNQESVNVIKSACLKLDYSDNGKPIHLLNSFPITESEADKLDAYEFTIRNTCNSEEFYQVNLDVLNVSERLASQYIAVKLGNNSKQLLTDYQRVELNNNAIESYGLLSGSLASGESKTIPLRLWIDEYTEASEETVEKNFQSKISVTALEKKSDVIYTENILDGADPVLKGELVPVTIGDNGVVRKANITEEWYSYEKKRWANAVILVNNQEYVDYEEIPEDNIESYFVWIPKYSYQLWDMGEYWYKDADFRSTGSIESKEHTIPIKFGLTNTSDSNESECTTPGWNENAKTYDGSNVSGSSGNCAVGDYMTHPSFLSMGTNGLWVGKFENGYNDIEAITSIIDTIEDANERGMQLIKLLNKNDLSNLVIKPDKRVWSNCNINNLFTMMYNYQRNLDSHMMKNTEWGAVAYLSHSIYGLNDKVRINNHSDQKTGYSATDSADQSELLGVTGNASDVTMFYNTKVGYKASTTGNITGIYDMSGGSDEYMASYIESTEDKSELDTSLYNEKYFDKYATDSYVLGYNKRILGDATGEMGPFAMYKESRTSSWYHSAATFLGAKYPFIYRGRTNVNGFQASQFAFGIYTGEASWVSSRMVLTP